MRFSLHDRVFYDAADGDLKQVRGRVVGELVYIDGTRKTFVQSADLTIYAVDSKDTHLKLDMSTGQATTLPPTSK